MRPPDLPSRLARSAIWGHSDPPALTTEKLLSAGLLRWLDYGLFIPTCLPLAHELLRGVQHFRVRLFCGRLFAIALMGQRWHK